MSADAWCFLLEKFYERGRVVVPMSVRDGEKFYAPERQEPRTATSDLHAHLAFGRRGATGASMVRPSRQPALVAVATLLASSTSYSPPPPPPPPPSPPGWQQAHAVTPEAACTEMLDNRLNTIHLDPPVWCWDIAVDSCLQYYSPHHGHLLPCRLDHVRPPPPPAQPRSYPA